MKFLLQEILKPATHRIGSVGSVLATTTGYFSPEQISTLEAALTILSGFILDLLVRKVL